MFEILGQRVNSIFVQKVVDNNLNVSVSVDPIEHRGKEIRITSYDIMEYLKNKGYDIETCLYSSVVTNTTEPYIGNWRFKLKFKEDFDNKKKIRKIT